MSTWIRSVMGAAAGAALVAGAAQAQTAIGPTLAEAKKALAAAQAAATKMNTNLSCVVVDARGDLVAAERMDKARFFTIDVARGKARTSAMFGQPSGNMATLATSKIDEAIGGGMLMLQGAVPITRNNQPHGAMGCSGGTGQQDEDAAKAGIAAMM